MHEENLAVLKLKIFTKNKHFYRKISGYFWRIFDEKTFTC